MERSHNTDYSYDQIEAVLSKIKNCIKKNKYQISLNPRREDNLEFISRYNLRKEDQKSILLGIETDDFCYSLQNEHEGFEHEYKIKNRHPARRRQHRYDLLPLGRLPGASDADPDRSLQQHRTGRGTDRPRRPQHPERAHRSGRG